MIRIVKMTFNEESISEFITIFSSVQPKIKAIPGCNELKLLTDKDNPSILFTYSEWNDEEDLTIYRNSQLFASTWSKVKKLFAQKAEAWSVEETSIQQNEPKVI